MGDPRDKAKEPGPTSKVEVGGKKDQISSSIEVPAKVNSKLLRTPEKKPKKFVQPMP